jgi:hypothetical protein
MLNALTNVRFEGKNGHDAGVTPFPLMTQSGHCGLYEHVGNIDPVGETPATARTR